MADERVPLRWVVLFLLLALGVGAAAVIALGGLLPGGEGGEGGGVLLPLVPLLLH
ncbi:hypothetical protein ACFQPA_13235 [Halomarina halobia]|uniref:Uncharacterized protein n=1 Tax=Halomarina halobia TaxID=3033386 RepID=A0ABD6A8S4_9EURY|nr:hypothetical protein [Halomarina sp. PSR21]